jgi:formylglycine-generating enzyme required for sulfatase activity
MVTNSGEGHGGDSKIRVFISYSRKDSVFADRLEGALKARGFEALIDRDEIYAFQDWWKRIQALIGRADTIVFVLSPDAVESDVALKEIAHGGMLNKRFAPIVWRRVDDDAVPEQLRRLNFIFFDDPEHFDASIGRLVDALQVDIGWIRQHTEYGEAERRWSVAGRPVGLSLQSPTLEVAEHWAVSRPRGAPEVTAEIQTFVLASRQSAQATQRRRRLTRASIYTLLVAIIFGLIGWINQEYIEQQWHWYATVRPFASAQVWPYVLSATAEQALKPGDTFRECASKLNNDYCPEMVVIPAGSFVMGSPPTEKLRSNREIPQHTVTFAKPFAVSKFEATFDEWDTCVAYGDCAPDLGDSGFGRGQRPVNDVTWDQAQRYVAWMTKMTGKSYRLLTESEWEYSARAGTQTAYYWGDRVGEGNANCAGCGSQWDSKETAPVGSFAANGFGLYDMLGNVWEWVEDCYHPTYDGAPTDGSAWNSADCRTRLIRGGSWDDLPGGVRSAYRYGITVGYRLDGLGFRLARTLTP